jgi:hypothetical protein
VVIAGPFQHVMPGRAWLIPATVRVPALNLGGPPAGPPRPGH